MLERYAQWAIFLPVATVFGLLLFPGPVFGIPAEILQGTIAALSCGIYALAAGTWLFRGRIGIPNNALLAGYLVLFLSTVPSMMINGFYRDGTFGNGFEFGTAGMFLLCLLTAHASSMMSHSDIKKLLMIFGCVLVCAIVLSALLSEADSLFLPQPDATTGSSFSILHATISASTPHALVGTGPNSYSYAFNLYRPSTFNYSPQWNVPVTSAPSSVLTLFTTLGALGLAAFLYATIVPLYSLYSTHGALAYMSFALAFIPLAVAYFFPVSTAMLLLSAIGAGFLARMTSETMISISVDLLRFFTGAVLVSIGVGIVFVGARQLFAAYSDAEGLALLSQGKAQEASAMLQRAGTSWESSAYSRDLARALIYRMNAMAASGKKYSNEDMKKLSDAALVAARNAAPEDGRDFLAWRDYIYVLAVLHAGGLPVDLKEADRALRIGKNYAPTRPDIYFVAAQLYAFEGDAKKALELVNTAIELKSDYADALALRTQIFR